MKLMLPILTILLLNCTPTEEPTQIEDASVDATPDAEVEKCEPAHTEYGYCTWNFEQEGVYDVQSYHNFSNEKTSTPYGYANITPRSPTTGALVLHTQGRIFFGHYYVQKDGTWYMNKAVILNRTFDGTYIELSYEGRNLHYIIDLHQDENLTLTFNVADPQPYFEEKPTNFKQDFEVTLSKKGEVGTCHEDNEELGLHFGYCHAGPICQKLFGGCTTYAICSIVMEELKYLYGSWQEPQSETCERRAYDPLMLWRFTTP